MCLQFPNIQLNVQKLMLKKYADIADVINSYKNDDSSALGVHQWRMFGLAKMLVFGLCRMFFIV